VGDSVNAAGGALQSAALGEASQDRVRKPGLSGLIGGYEPVVLFGYGQELIEAGSWHVNIFPS
jgi:hypothetical protein